MEGRGSGTRGGDKVVLQWLLRTMASDTRLKLYPGQCDNLPLMSPSSRPHPTFRKFYRIHGLPHVCRFGEFCDIRHT